MKMQSISPSPGIAVGVYLYLYCIGFYLAEEMYATFLVFLLLPVEVVNFPHCQEDAMPISFSRIDHLKKGMLLLMEISM